MKISDAQLAAMAANPAQFPKDGLPEIALVGRSNVGKSSFINRMVGRKKLAFTSSRPGKTQTINFYRINGQFYFVDLPGYGYAQVSKQQQAAWGKLIEAYLRNRPTLHFIIQLVDIRHKPTEQDRQMQEFLRWMDTPHLLVATKADKVARGHWLKHVNIIRKELDLEPSMPVYPFSAQDGAGREEVWKTVEEYLFHRTTSVDKS